MTRHGWLRNELAEAVRWTALGLSCSAAVVFAWATITVYPWYVVGALAVCALLFIGCARHCGRRDRRVQLAAIAARAEREHAALITQAADPAGEYRYCRRAPSATWRESCRP